MRVIKKPYLKSLEESKFLQAIELFNSQEWYLAHDLLEEIWHETNVPERTTIQGLLQIAVAQLHLDKGNMNGATILYGEALGRLKANAITDLGLDISSLCKNIEERLSLLQKGLIPKKIIDPVLLA